jgi:NhaP-type Na+/H+ or K+/H+ antiporter
VLGTLVLQGLTLRPLLLWLRLEDDDTVEREVRLARVETLRAALAAAEECLGAETAELLRHRYQLQLRRAEQELAGDGAGEGRTRPAAAARKEAGCQDGDEAVIRVATEARRRRLMSLRADGTIGDAAFQRVEEELDWAELDWAQLVRAGERSDGEG